MKTLHKIFFLFIFFAVIIGVLLSSSQGKRTIGINSAQAWYAVHLSNNQTYFGNLQTITPDTITLINTYYLDSYTAPAQINSVATSTNFQVKQENTPQQVYSLTRRGSNDNMTTDNTLYLDRHAVLFWERLSPEAPMTLWLEKANKTK